jgi:transposase
MTHSTLSHLGIDIAKQSFDVALLTPDRQPKHKKFANSMEGFLQLDAWLKQQMAGTVHACLEATGTYGDALARHLLSQKHIVSIVNPSALKAFARTKLSRTKTDKADALRIAQFCQLHQPRFWTPPMEEIATLTALVRRLESLQQMEQMEQQRKEGASPAVIASIEAVITFLVEQIAQVHRQIREHIDQHPDLKEQKELLESIPGIGPTTASLLLAELGDWERFESSRAVAAFAGLCPRLHESGTSVRGRSTLCKMGNPRLRRGLYFPAMSALRHNPIIREMGERLSAAGKTKMVILGAAMRRLLQIAFGVLRSAKPFDPEISRRSCERPATI